MAKKIDRYDAVAGDWCLSECHDFVWDDWNIIHEMVSAIADGLPRVVEIQYFWGQDMSATLQGAGGVGGLLAVSCNGNFHFPVYDNNGNVMQYVNESGVAAASFVYDDFGKVISQSSSSSIPFNFGFSTKYTDRETGLLAYHLRSYHLSHRHWLNRDPIEEQGGENLYAFCGNNPLMNFDKGGLAYFAVRQLNSSAMKRFSNFRGGFLDRWNVECVHEQLFFQDGKPDGNKGYFDDSIVKTETSDQLEKSQYIMTRGGFDDCIMRKAVERVKPKPYSLLGVSIKKEKYNCQNWAEEVRAEYYRIKNDPNTKNECRKNECYKERK